MNNGLYLFRTSTNPITSDTSAKLRTVSTGPQHPTRSDSKSNQTFKKS